MIYSNTQMRWAEVQFYKFCEDVYNANSDLIDLAYIIETICRLGKIENKPIKTLAGKILSDPYFRPSKLEIIHIARLNEYSFADIAKMLRTSRQAVRQIMERQKTSYYPTPKLSVIEDEQIIQFINCLKIYQKVGLVV